MTTLTKVADKQDFINLLNHIAKETKRIEDDQITRPDWYDDMATVKVAASQAKDNIK